MCFCFLDPSPGHRGPTIALLATDLPCVGSDRTLQRNGGLFARKWDLRTYSLITDLRMTSLLRSQIISLLSICILVFHIYKSPSFVIVCKNNLHGPSSRRPLFPFHVEVFLSPCNLQFALSSPLPTVTFGEKVEFPGQQTLAFEF